MSERWQIRSVEIIGDLSGIFPPRFSVQLMGYAENPPQVGAYVVDAREHDRICREWRERAEDLEARNAFLRERLEEP